MTHDWWYAPFSFFFYFVACFYGAVGHRAPLQLDLHLVWPLRTGQELLPAPFPSSSSSSKSSSSTIRNGSSSWPARRPPTTRGPLPALLNTNCNSPGHLPASRTLVTRHQPLATAAGCRNLSTASWTTPKVPYYYSLSLQIWWPSILIFIGRCCCPINENHCPQV